MLLSICIPTFNRKDQLSNLIGFLENEICDDVEVVIIDNASDYVPENVPAIRNVLETGKSFRIIRNRSNVGFGANLMKCFELAEGQWVWTLGDDDLPVKGAIRSVVSILSGSANIQAFNFASTILSNQGISRDEIIEASGILDFATKVDSFSNLLFISTSIYKKNRIIPHLRVGYYMIDSCAPHLAMLFSATQSHKDSVVFHSYELVHWKPNETDHWNYKFVFPKLRKLFSLIEDDNARIILASKNAKVHPLGSIKIEWTPRQLKRRIFSNDENIYNYFIGLNETFRSLTIDNGKVSPKLIGLFILSIASLTFCSSLKNLLRWLFSFSKYIPNYFLSETQSQGSPRAQTTSVIDDERL